MIKFTLTAIFAFALTLFLSGQSVIWNDVPDPKREKQQIRPESYRTMTVDFEFLKAQLLAAPSGEKALRESDYSIQLPTPDGGFANFKIAEESIMATELQVRYPNIRTYVGLGTGDYANANVSLDFTYKGFHAQILIDGKSYYIDPLSPDDLNTYIIYTRESFFRTNTKDMACASEDAHAPQPSSNVLGDKPSEATEVIIPMTSSGTELRTYRLALACTGEYAQFHGGTKPLALSAMVTTVNRVSGIYSREVCLKMELVSNNDDLIFLDPTTDGYTNNNGVAMLGENQTKINFIIGASNYDIGHVFSTGGGGIAGLGVVCGSYKARGVTGGPSPVSDPFDIDYVAHEMGHQWGASHTFNNSCSGNRTSSAAYEPGSGSTIMSYAGICLPNLQSNSDAYFHNHSYNQIVTFSVTGNGNSCATITPALNSPPVVTVPASGFSIPKSTPFELTASATDPDNDLMTYCWEQYNLGPATAIGDNSLTNPSGNAPIFRSWSPTSSSTRVFPRVSDLINNTSVIGELLPTYARALTFKCTVRDSRVNGGVSDAQVAFEVASNSGPFVVTSPNSAVTWTAGANATITWSVANTTASPVNCSKVDIYLSTDGGYTYPTLLIANTNNDGLQTIVVPNLPTTQARVKVKARSNIFFDISDQNFIIVGTVPAPENDAVCDAIQMSCGQSIDWTTIGATASSVGNPTCSFGSQKDVFFYFVALANVDYSVTVNGDNYDGVIAAYTGSCTGTLTEIDCSDLGFDSGIAETIYISVPIDQYVIIRTYDYFGVGQTDFTITLNCPIPDNDDCADAILLSVNNFGECPDNQVEGTTYGATASSPDACESDSPDVYYKFNSGSNTEVIISLANISANDLVLSVFEGSCSVESSSCHFGSGSVLVSVTPSTTYYVRVHSWEAFVSGTFNICIEKVAPELGSLTGSIAWNTSCGERDATVKLYEPGTATPVASYDVSIQADGTFNIADLEIGTFDIIIKVDGYLAKGIQSVGIASGDNSLALGSIINGNMNNDGVVNISDFAIFASAFPSLDGDANYNYLADFNCDGKVNLTDFPLFVTGFNKLGDTAPLTP